MTIVEILATIIIAPAAMFFGVGFAIATFQMLKECIDEIKRRN